MFKIVQRSRDSWLDLAGGLRLQAVKYWTHAKHARSWSVMPAGALQDKKYKLAVQLPRGWNSQLSQAASPSRQPALFWKTWLFAFHSLQYKYPLYPWNVESSQREYWKRNPREKQDWLIHNLHIETLQIPLLSSFTLILSIVTSLGALLPKPFLTIPTYVRRPFGAWEAVRKGPISYWLMLWFIAESGKLKKK